MLCHVRRSSSRVDPGAAAPQPARTRFASSCHRTTTGSPGPSPWLACAPAAFCSADDQLAGLLGLDAILGLVAEVGALVDRAPMAGRCQRRLPSARDPAGRDLEPLRADGDRHRVADANGRRRVGDATAQVEPRALRDDDPARSTLVDRLWTDPGMKLDVPMKSATNRLTGRS